MQNRIKLFCFNVGILSGLVLGVQPSLFAAFMVGSDTVVAK